MLTFIGLEQQERVVIERMISWWTPASAVGSVKLLWLENEREALEFPDVDLHRPGAALACTLLHPRVPFLPP